MSNWMMLKRDSLTLSVVDLRGSPSAGSSSFRTASFAFSAPLRAARPIRLPSRFRPPPTPWAVSFGCSTAWVTASAVPTTESLRPPPTTSARFCSRNSAMAAISWTRMASWFRP